MPSEPQWTTVGGMDSETPVVLLGDLRLHDRSAVVLLNDGERITLLRMIELARQRRDAMQVRDERHRITDHWLVRVGGILAIGVALTDMIANIAIVLHGGFR